MPTGKLRNSEARFSIIAKNNSEFLVCSSVNQSLRIRYVENLKTGKRVFPTDDLIESTCNKSVPFPTPDLDKQVL